MADATRPTRGDTWTAADEQPIDLALTCKGRRAIGVTKRHKPLRIRLGTR